VTRLWRWVRQVTRIYPPPREAARPPAPSERALPLTIAEAKAIRRRAELRIGGAFDSVLLPDPKERR
jgi:hypothetical protein